jgi:pyruvate formate lyase activating enzyme
MDPTVDTPPTGARPWVVDLKRNSLDDGPGIRTVVFFKGCPLRCAWCQNPETVSPLPVLQRSEEACLGCRECEAACPVHRARPAREPEPQDIACTRCGACVEACPSDARRLSGTQWDAAALEQALLRDAVFYRRSGGGVTLSGGEPALFSEYVGGVAAGLRRRDVHVLIETCGHFAWEPFARHLLPHLSTVYFDLKLADPARHRQWAGRDNALIHENLRRLVASGHADVLPRIPLIPGVTDDDENLQALAALVRAVGLGRVALLPYNPLWVGKRRALGLELPYAHTEWMSKDDVARCRAAVERAGVRVMA